MGALADKVQLAYTDRTVREIRIDEWDVTVHVGPITVKQLGEILAESDAVKRAITVLRVRAKKADGTPAFDAEDLEKLHTHGCGAFGPDVVIRVAREIGESDATPEEVEKK